MQTALLQPPHSSDLAWPRSGENTFSTARGDRQHTYRVGQPAIHPVSDLGSSLLAGSRWWPRHSVNNTNVPCRVLFTWYHCYGLRITRDVMHPATHPGRRTTGLVFVLLLGPEDWEPGCLSTVRSTAGLDKFTKHATPRHDTPDMILLCTAR